MILAQELAAALASSHGEPKILKTKTHMKSHRHRNTATHTRSLFHLSTMCISDVNSYSSS